MRKELWPGEAVFKDAIDLAVRNYVDASTRFARENPDADGFEEWEDHDDVPVGWVVLAQTLGIDDGEDVDGIMDVTSTGMSRFTTIGMLRSHASWLEEQ